MSSILEIDSIDEFNELISSDKLVVVCYFSFRRGCHAKIVDVLLPKIAETYPNVTFVKIYIDRFPEIDDSLKFYSIPYFRCFKEGEMLGEYTGMFAPDNIKKMINDCL